MCSVLPPAVCTVLSVLSVRCCAWFCACFCALLLNCVRVVSVSLLFLCVWYLFFSTSVSFLSLFCLFALLSVSFLFLCSLCGICFYAVSVSFLSVQDSLTLSLSTIYLCITSIHYICALYVLCSTYLCMYYIYVCIYLYMYYIYVSMYISIYVYIYILHLYITSIYTLHPAPFRLRRLAPALNYCRSIVPLHCMGLYP